MGTMSHDALIVMTYDEHAEEARKKVIAIAEGIEVRNDGPFEEDWAGLVSPILPAITNGYATFFIAPDGSKEWWGTSDRGDEFREAVIKELAPDHTVVHVRWGEFGDRINVHRDRD